VDHAVALLREFGFPIFVCIWFMRQQAVHNRMVLEQLHKLVIANSVIARTLDIPGDAMQRLPERSDHHG
jgi:hypothetical protein